jgi:hypothetical protein
MIVMIVLVVGFLIGGPGRGWSKKSHLGMGLAAILMIAILLYLMGILR